MHRISDLATHLKISERAAYQLLQTYTEEGGLSISRVRGTTIQIPDEHFNRIKQLHHLSQRYVLPFAGLARMLLNHPVDVLQETITSFVSPVIRDPQQRADFLVALNSGRALLGAAPFPPLPPSQDQGAELLTRLGKLSLDFDDLRREVNAAVTRPAGSVKVAGPKRGEES